MALLATNKRKDEMKKVAEARPRGAQFGEESKEEAVARATKMYVMYASLIVYVMCHGGGSPNEDRWHVVT